MVDMTTVMSTKGRHITFDTDLLGEDPTTVTSYRETTREKRGYTYSEGGMTFDVTEEYVEDKVVRQESATRIQALYRGRKARRSTSSILQQCNLVPPCISQFF